MIERNPTEAECQKTSEFSTKPSQVVLRQAALPPRREGVAHVAHAETFDGQWRDQRVERLAAPPIGIENAGQKRLGAVATRAAPATAFINLTETDPPELSSGAG